mgnify:CR=1 FL=1
MKSKPAKRYSTAEPHWGDPNRSQVRRDTTRGERIRGITWLSIGALFGLFVSVLYLGVRITVGDMSIPFPWVIVFAGVFNWAITKTALLWTPNKAIASIPMWVWLVGFLAVLMSPVWSSSGDVFLPSTLTTFGLLAVGLISGVVPVMYVDLSEVVSEPTKG